MVSEMAGPEEVMEEENEVGKQKYLEFYESNWTMKGDVAFK